MEGEKLISHRLDADDDGRPIVRTEPEHEEEEEWEARPVAPRADDLDRTGRPDWLVRLENLPLHQRRIVQTLSLVVLILFLIGIFSFSLSGLTGNGKKMGSKKTRPKGKAPIAPHEQAWADHSAGTAFPTYIGYPGTYKTSAPAQLADDMKPLPSPTRGVEPIHTSIPQANDHFHPFQHMGSLSPYFSAQHGTIDNARFDVTPVSANGTCTLTQVHILHRHGSRYPTGGAPTRLVKELLRRPHGDGQSLWFDGPLAFLNTYEYRLGEELLVPLGREQLHMSGTKAAIDYERLAADDLAQGRRLFIRAGSQQRILDSAIAWATGFWGNGWAAKTNLEIQIEEPGFNTTLAPNFACPAAADSFSVKSYVDEYLGAATRRLQPHVHGAELTPSIVYGMQQLCAYDTVAFGRSDFCALFTEDEWKMFEFAWDQQFYYNYGAGHAAGPAMGLGWLNEFVARLTHTPWNASTQTSENSTFNSRPEYFPLDRHVYADFTHDSVLTSVLAALRLPSFSKAPELVDKERPFRTSLIVPFGARIVFEVFDCPAPVMPSFDKRRIPLKAMPGGPYIRMKLNDAIVPLGQLPQCEDRLDGLCKLQHFLESQADRNEQGWWGRCHT